MSNFNRIRFFLVIITLVFLIILLIVGGLIWFDVLGVVDSSVIFKPLLVSLGLRADESVVIDYSNLELLDSISIQKRQLAIDLRIQELELIREALVVDVLSYEDRLAQLEEREKKLAEREKSFNQKVNRYDDRKAGLIQNANDLVSMRPNDAVEILNEYDDQLLIDTLRTIQELADEAGTFSLVPTYLSLLPEERVATVQRKMTLKPLPDSNF